MESAPAPEGYDLVAVGYWVDKGMPDAQAKAYLETVRDAKVGFCRHAGLRPVPITPGTASRQGEALVNAPERRNKVLGTYLCQGKVDPKIVAMMQKMASDVHPHDARTQGAPRRSGQASRRGRLPPGAGSLQGVRGTGGLTGQKDQRGSGPETGRAALPPIRRVQETLMNLASIYASIGPSGVALVFVGCAGLYLALRNLLYLHFVWRDFKRDFLDIEHQEGRCMRDVCDKSDNPLIAIIRDVVKTHGGHSKTSGPRSLTCSTAISSRSRKGCAG